MIRLTLDLIRPISDLIHRPTLPSKRRYAGKTIRLAWKKPADGGKPATYEIRCRERTGNEPRGIVGLSMTTEAALTGQERGKELEYVVLAINKAGEGPESNAVVAVL